MAVDFAAGCIGGCAGIIVGHPLDTIKVHLQTQDASRPKYKGTFHCFRSLLAKEGTRGLYRGMTSPLGGVAVINAIVFGVHGNMQKRMGSTDSLAPHFITGAVAGFVQSAICSPMELVKTRVQLSVDKRGPLNCLKNIYKCEGTRGVFKGLGITTLREVPAFGSYFLTYEMLTRTENNVQASTATMLLAGGISGCVSWVIVYPVDVVKSRIQADGMQGLPQYKSSWDCLRKSVNKEGFSFLTRGLTSTLIRAFPTNAACFTAVTWSIRLFSGDIELECGTSDSKQEKTALWTHYEKTMNSIANGDSPAAFT